MTHLTTVFHTPSWLLVWLPEMAQESQNLLLHLLPTRWAPLFGILTTVEQPNQCLQNTSYHSPGTLLLRGNGQLRAKHFAHEVRIGFRHVYPYTFTRSGSHVFLPSHYASKDPSGIFHIWSDFFTARTSLVPLLFIPLFSLSWIYWTKHPAALAM